MDDVSEGSASMDHVEERTTMGNGVTPNPLKRYVTFVENSKNKWYCNFGCRTEPYAGSYYSRIKSHLIGIYPRQKSHLRLCPKVSENKRKKMRSEEDEASNVFGNNGTTNLNPLERYVTFLGGSRRKGKWMCNFSCRTEPYSGFFYDRIKSHLIGIYPRQNSHLRLCPKVSENERRKMKREDDEASNMVFGKKHSRNISVPSLPVVSLTHNTSEMVPSDAPAVVAGASPIVPPEIHEETAPIITDLPRDAPAVVLGVSPVVPQEVPEKTELTITDLPSDPENLGRNLALAPGVKSSLYLELMPTVDVDSMVEKSTICLSYSDELGVDDYPFFDDEIREMEEALEKLENRKKC